MQLNYQLFCCNFCFTKFLKSFKYIKIFKNKFQISKILVEKLSLLVFLSLLLSEQENFTFPQRIVCYRAR